MTDWENLKNNKELLAGIDWDLTPQEAFQKYQIKSINAWKHGSPPDVYYFYVSVRRGDKRVVLVKRTLKHTEIIHEIPVPVHLVEACLTEQAGNNPRSGQYDIDNSIRAWLLEKLGL
ncbi:MAG: hypothetical protein JRD68_03585 [Deltaproteobacteria bacterium]|nr:hypothetical protein [Deltaproteobacteria bacterium]